MTLHIPSHQQARQGLFKNRRQENKKIYMQYILSFQRILIPEYLFVFFIKKRHLAKEF